MVDSFSHRPRASILAAAPYRLRRDPQIPPCPNTIAGAIDPKQTFYPPFGLVNIGLVSLSIEVVAVQAGPTGAKIIFEDSPVYSSSFPSQQQLTKASGSHRAK